MSVTSAAAANESVVNRTILKASTANLLKFPLLEDMEAVVVRTTNSLQLTLTQKPASRRFELTVEKANLRNLGFLKSDTLDDCFAIVKGVYEGGDDPSVARGSFTVTTVAIAQMRTKYGDMTELCETTFDECTAIQVHVTEKTMRREPLVYVLLLMETATEGGGDDLCEVGALKKELALWKLRTTVTLASSHCWAAAGALCSMQQLKRIWKPEEGDSAQLFALRDNRCTLLIRAPGVYKFHPLEDNLFVNSRRVTRRYIEHTDADAISASMPTSSYVVGLEAGDEVFITPFSAHKIGNANLTVTKL